MYFTYSKKAVANVTPDLICGPSYKFLPDIHRNVICSGRGKTESEILNDVWISSPSDPDKYFKYSHKTQYELNLFNCEDSIYEWDMRKEWLDSTIRRLSYLQKFILSKSKYCFLTLLTIDLKFFLIYYPMMHYLSCKREQ